MKIFLSAVSGQFKTCRDQLASDLRAVGAEVVVQEDFQQHGRTLLEKLEHYIAGCDRVIALVGDTYGWEPEPAALPGGTPRRSYTQWEYFFAQGERLDGGRETAKDLFVYLASANFVTSNPVGQTEEASKLQQQFLEEIRRSGKDRNSFGSLDELCRLVLRDGFRLRERQRPPQNLPYPSLALPGPKETSVPTEDKKERVRAYNRERLERAGCFLWIHGITFFFLFGAFYLPLLLKSMPGQDIPFSSTRFSVLGVDRSIDHEQLAWLSCTLALVLYIPLWLLSQQIGHFVATVGDQLHKVSLARYESLIALSFFALSFLLAGHWVYVLYPQNSYLMSLALPFLAVFGVGILMSSRR
jgi:hypothetical protein